MEYRTDDELFQVDYIPQFLTDVEAKDLYVKLEKTLPKQNKRQAIIYADTDIIYSIYYRNKKFKRDTLSWTPELSIIKTKLESFLYNQYNIKINLNTCVVQRYPNGKAVINPHRDKELNSNTPICGISLGQTRILEMSNYKKTILSLPLENQSMYILLPGTNDYYTHAIKKDDSKNIRISLTFRNYL